MSEAGNIWVRSVRYHSYHNVLREPDTFYQVDNAQDLETVKANGLAVHEVPPATAQRSQPPPDAAPDLPVLTTEARIMTTADVPTVPASRARRGR